MMSERIKVTEDQAIAIATMQYDRAQKYRRPDEPALACEEVYVTNLAAEIMKNGATKDEIKLARD
jgi:hypothetical protein